MGSLYTFFSILHHDSSWLCPFCLSLPGQVHSGGFWLDIPAGGAAAGWWEEMGSGENPQKPPRHQRELLWAGSAHQAGGHCLSSQRCPRTAPRGSAALRGALRGGMAPVCPSRAANTPGAFSAANRACSKFPELPAQPPSPRFALPALHLWLYPAPLAQPALVIPGAIMGELRWLWLLWFLMVFLMFKT